MKTIEDIKDAGYEILYVWEPKPALDILEWENRPLSVVVVKHKQSAGQVYEDDTFLFAKYFENYGYKLIAFQPFSMLIAHLLKKFDSDNLCQQKKSI